MWVIRPVRKMRARRREGLQRVEVRGLGHLRAARERGQGVVITAGHAGHADPYIFLAATDKLDWPCYYLVGWQVFHLLGPVGRWVLTRHGCFSIDREGNDIRAFRQAVDIVQRSGHPLVIFAEGEVYHNHEWVAPFRPGAAAIALAAAKRAARPVVCIPSAIRYHYLDDPTPHLLRVTELLERKIGLAPPLGLALPQRLYRFALALVAQKEQAYLGREQAGEFPDRLAGLIGAILGRLEARYGTVAEADVPGRVTHLRQEVIRRTEKRPPDDPGRRQDRRDLDDLSLVIQLYSYAKDYLSDRPSLEHVAEIVDKFEEDVLGALTARIRGNRRATLLFGPPVEVQPGKGKKEEARLLTETMQQKVQNLLDDLNGVPHRVADKEWVRL
jgi:1-acyl-sn-glycerol-3-phosphate acyltransferase